MQRLQVLNECNILNRSGVSHCRLGGLPQTMPSKNNVFGSPSFLFKGNVILRIGIALFTALKSLGCKAVRNRKDTKLQAVLDGAHSEL